MTDGLRVVPANRASWEDLQTVFGTRGTAHICQCQRFKLRRLESFASFPAEERARRLLEQTNCGDPRARTTSGLVAYLDGEPVGWCAVEPRTAYEGLVRNNRVPWTDREEDRSDESVWAVTCLFTRAGFRRRGITYALAQAAVEPRAGPRCPCARGVSADHLARNERDLGRAARWQPRRVRRSGAHRGQPPDAATARDADRLH